jgi:hypothetical protein
MKPDPGKPAGGTQRLKFVIKMPGHEGLHTPKYIYPSFGESDSNTQCCIVKWDVSNTPVLCVKFPDTFHRK